VKRQLSAPRCKQKIRPKKLFKKYQNQTFLVVKSSCLCGILCHPLMSINCTTLLQQAYIQQLESSRIRLAQLEQELHTARAQVKSHRFGARTAKKLKRIVRTTNPFLESAFWFLKKCIYCIGGFLPRQRPPHRPRRRRQRHPHRRHRRPQLRYGTHTSISSKKSP
jgi:hypothetical protein